MPSKLNTAMQWPADTSDPSSLPGGLQSRLLDSAPPMCVTGRHGKLIYGNAAYQIILSHLDNRADPPLGNDGDQVSLTIGERAERFTLHTQYLEAAAGTPALVITTFERQHDSEWAGNALDKALERLEDITRLVTDWIWETGRDLRLNYVSPRVRDTLGFHQAELTGRALTDLLLTPDPTLQALRKPENRKPFRGIEVQIADRGGKPRDLQLSGLPVFCQRSGEFLGYRGTAHDVTEIRWREAAIRGAKDDAELASRAKSEFLANMSHELRTPLNAIIGFSEIMGGEMLGPLGTDQYKGYVHDIADSARHLLALISDILDSAKIESGQMSLSETEVDLGDLIDSVVRLMTPRAGRAGVSLHSHTGTGHPCVLADETKIKQILINLTANSVKFSNPGGRIDLRAAQNISGEMEIMVCDTGIGIAAADIARALAPFGQVESHSHISYEGTGLGLPLAKSMTEMHGGTFELVSQPGVGTTVTLRLPESRVLLAS